MAVPFRPSWYSPCLRTGKASQAPRPMRPLARYASFLPSNVPQPSSRQGLAWIGTHFEPYFLTVFRTQKTPAHSLSQDNTKERKGDHIGSATISHGPPRQRRRPASHPRPPAGRHLSTHVRGDWLRRMNVKEKGKKEKKKKKITSQNAIISIPRVCGDTAVRIISVGCFTRDTAVNLHQKQPVKSCVCRKL